MRSAWRPLMMPLRSYRDARRRSGDVLAGRADELIAAYRYSELLRLAQGFESRGTPARAAAHYAAAEKLLDRRARACPRRQLPVANGRVGALGNSSCPSAATRNLRRRWLEKFRADQTGRRHGRVLAICRGPRGPSCCETAISSRDRRPALDWSPIERPRHRIGYQLNSSPDGMVHSATSLSTQAHTAAGKCSGDGWEYPLQTQPGVLVGAGLRAARGLGGQPAGV